MFKQLNRSQRVFNIAQNAWVAVNFPRNKSSDDLKKNLAKAFDNIQQKLKMDIESKMKELTDLFSKTGKELSDIVKQNEKFISEEIKRAEDTIRKSSEECANKHMDRLQKVKETYEKQIKVCNDKTAKGLSAAKIKYEEQIGTTDVLRDSMKRILKECLDTDEFVKCVATKTKETAKQRDEIIRKLNDTMKSAETSIAEQLKEAVKCHAEAQAESLQKLGEILKDTKDCLVQPQ